MRTYTQADFDAMPMVDGVKVCASGDYSAIKKFGDKTKFGNWTTFGTWTKFGDRTKFGNWTTFGSEATFGNRTTFGSEATFGNWTTFGDKTTFGDRTKFGNWTTFGSETTIEGVAAKSVMTMANVDGSGRQVLIWSDGNTVRVRAGCFAGTADEFCAKAESEGKAHYAAIMRAIAPVMLAKAKGE